MPRKEQNLEFIANGFLRWREYDSWKKHNHPTADKEVEVYVYTMINQNIAEFQQKYHSLNLYGRKRKNNQKAMRKKAKKKINEAITLLDKINCIDGLLKLVNVINQFWAYTSDPTFSDYMESAWEKHQINYKLK